MTIEKRIRDALLTFGDPVQKGIYLGTGEKWFTFGYTTVPEVYGDDRPDAVRHLIDVHFFAPWTYDTAKRIPKVCLALESAGFTYPVVTSAGDQEGQHIVFDCEYAGGVPNGND